MNPILIVILMTLFLVGCEATVTTNVNATVTHTADKSSNTSSETSSQPAAATPTVVASPTPTPSPSPTMANTDCWNNRVKKNGAEWASYSTASRAAGNTWYACDGSGSVGGVWIAFYSDNTVYWGGLSPGFVFSDPGVNNSDCSKFEWKNTSGDVYGYATDATLDHNSKLTSITITKWMSATNHTYYPVETLSCSEVF